jgi:hypothetical protein
MDKGRRTRNLLCGCFYWINIKLYYRAHKGQPIKGTKQSKGNLSVLIAMEIESLQTWELLFMCPKKLFKSHLLSSYFQPNTPWQGPSDQSNTYPEVQSKNSSSVSVHSFLQGLSLRQSHFHVSNTVALYFLNALRPWSSSFVFHKLCLSSLTFYEEFSECLLGKGRLTKNSCHLLKRFIQDYWKTERGRAGL